MSATYWRVWSEIGSSYQPPPPPPSTPGRVRLDGTAIRCADPTTQEQPDATWAGTTATGQPLTVAAWERVHFRTARDQPFTLLRVCRPTATGKKRDPRVSWFIWRGSTALPLDQVWATYLRRYSIEHTFRFVKQDLGWAKARLRTPAQFERWTRLVMIALAQLRLAQQSVQGVYRPWEPQTRPATPRQVRRAMAGVLAQVGTPARPPQQRKKGRGRTQGQKLPPRERFAVVRSTKKQAKSAQPPPASVT